MRAESSLEEQAAALAREHGWMSRKLQWVGRRAAPDRLFLHPDHGPVFVEFKDPQGALDPRQRAEIRRMKEHGARVHVVDNLRAFKAVMGISSG